MNESAWGDAWGDAFGDAWGTVEAGSAAVFFTIEASQTYAASIIVDTYAASIEARQARPE